MFSVYSLVIPPSSALAEAGLREGEIISKSGVFSVRGEFCVCGPRP